MEEYKRSSDAWRARTRAAEQVRNAFSEFLEGDTTDAAESSPPAAAPQPGTGNKKRKRPKNQEAEEAAGSVGYLSESENVTILLEKPPASENTTGERTVEEKKDMGIESAPAIDEGKAEPEAVSVEGLSVSEGKEGEKTAKKRKKKRNQKHGVEDSSNNGGGSTQSAAALEGPDGGSEKEERSKKSKKQRGAAEGEGIETDTGGKKKKKRNAAAEEGSLPGGKEVSNAEKKAVGAVKASGKVVMEEDGLVNLQVFEDRTPQRAKKGKRSKGSKNQLGQKLQVALPEGWEATPTALLFEGKPSTLEQRASLKGKAKGVVRSAYRLIEAAIQKQKKKEESLLLRQAANKMKRKAANNK